MTRIRHQDKYPAYLPTYLPTYRPAGTGLTLEPW